MNASKHLTFDSEYVSVNFSFCALNLFTSIRYKKYQSPNPSFEWIFIEFLRNTILNKSENDTHILAKK